MADNKKTTVKWKAYECQPGETVLDTLLRHKVNLPHSCGKMSCMMRSLSGMPSLKSQRHLKETLQLQNNFLACGCIPEQDMDIVLPQEVLTHQVTATVTELNLLSPLVMELILNCTTPIDYHGGQSVLLLNYEHIGKKFSITSPGSTRTSGRIEVHVEHTCWTFFWMDTH